MRETLARYLNLFGKIYPKRPPTEVATAYERALSDLTDLALSAACEICLRECTFYPTPAEIRKRLPPPDLFVKTAVPFKEEELSPEDLNVIGTRFKELAAKLAMDDSSKKKRVQEQQKTFGWTGISFTATVKPGSALLDWAKHQDLRDDLPRSPTEIDFIRTIQRYEKPRCKRSKQRANRAE